MHAAHGVNHKEIGYQVVIAVLAYSKAYLYRVVCCIVYSQLKSGSNVLHVQLLERKSNLKEEQAL